MKEPKFDLECVKETFMEAKKSFMEASTSSSKDQLEPGMETCMKLLHDRKAIKGLKEHMTKCAGSGEQRVVQKIGENAL